MNKFFIVGLLIAGVIAFSFFSMPVNKAVGQCTTEQAQKAGCCSRHGGVCGCNTEKHLLKCCDGTLSKSCGC